MQLALFTPLFVWIYMKREWCGHLFVFIVLVAQIIGVCSCCITYGLRAGPFAEENWYLFAYMFQKPFMKFHNFALGVSAAFFYMKILDFRRIPDEESRKAKYPIINYIHRSTWPHVVMFTFGFLLIAVNLLIGHSAVAKPYSWT